MRPTWQGNISFGLVSIPVKLYTAVREQKTSFNLLHKEDNGRIEYKKQCTECGQELSAEEIVKGFQFEKNEYVQLTDEDFEEAKLESSHTLDILDFIEPDQINPIYIDNSYYMEADKKGTTPYALLREAMKQTGKVGLCKVTFRTKEQLGAVRAEEQFIILDTLHYAADIASTEELFAPDASVEVGKRELDLAKMLIENMSGEFEPEKYTNQYEEAIREVIEAKLDGKEITREKKTATPTNVVDIMAKLKESLEKSGGESSPEAEAKPSRAKKKSA